MIAAALGWLAGGGAFGLARWMWILVAGALIAGAAHCAIRIADNAVETTVSTAKQAGAAEAVAAGQDITIRQTGAAHDARVEIRNDDRDARFCECLRTASGRTAGHCIRFLPLQPVPGDAADPGADCPGAGNRWSRQSVGYG